jgi:hypothetical protein
MKRLPILLVVLYFASTAATRAQDEFQLHTSEGAIVVRDGAPLYESSSGATVVMKFHRGDAVAGYNRHRAVLARTYFFEEADGRLQVTYLAAPSGPPEFGWMDSRDLFRFTYDGTCTTDSAPYGRTVRHRGDDVQKPAWDWGWNSCFEEARVKNLRALRASATF